MLCSKGDVEDSFEEASAYIREDAEGSRVGTLVACAGSLWRLAVELGSKALQHGGRLQDHSGRKSLPPSAGRSISSVSGRSIRAVSRHDLITLALIGAATGSATIMGNIAFPSRTRRSGRRRLTGSSGPSEPGPDADVARSDRFAIFVEFN
jgi:hypothetical protein